MKIVFNLCLIIGQNEILSLLKIFSSSSLIHNSSNKSLKIFFLVLNSFSDSKSKNLSVFNIVPLFCFRIFTELSPHIADLLLFNKTTVFPEFVRF